MEGNEIEKAAEELVAYEYEIDYPEECIWIKGFKAGANWQKERDNAEIERLKAALKSEVEVNRVFRMCNEKDRAELTRTNAQLDEMVTKYNELSKKYADLYTKHYGK